MDDIAYVIAEMKGLCDKWFLDPMTQSYPGSNAECMYCGARYHRLDRDRIDHSEDCPYLIYKKMLDNL